MKTTELISVIIPVYNVEQYLNRCVDTIINQTYKNLEIILVDDGSTDNSGKMCDEYSKKDNRIKVIHKQNGGLPSARNAGLDIAKGRYIGFVDSDDYVEKDMYEVLYNLLVENRVEVSSCNYFIVNKDKEVLINEYSFSEILSFNDILEKIKIKDGIFIFNKLYDRYLIRAIRVNENFSLGEDLDFNFRVLQKAKKVAFCKDAKYYYCYNPNSISRKQIFKKEYLLHILLYEEILKYCKENNLTEALKNNKQKQFYWIIKFLFIISQTGCEQKEDLKFLLQYLRKDINYWLFGNYNIKTKFFLLLSCMNFNLASKVHRLMLKLKKVE